MANEQGQGQLTHTIKGRLVSHELGASGITKDNRPWQKHKYVIEGEEGQARSYSSFLDFKVNLGTMVEAVYTEKEIPGYQYPMKDLKMLKVLAQQTNMSQQFQTPQAPIQVQDANFRPDPSKPQPVITLAETDVIMFADAYRQNVEPSLWSPNHFIGTFYRSRKPDQFVKIIEIFNDKVLGK
jgi:hypothetical protein